MSRRYKGAIISATPPTTSTTSASGDWTLQQQAQAQAAGTWPYGGPFNYIEDVFSTYLYAGNNTARSIVNNIDLSTKGGMLWIKDRTDAGTWNVLVDSARGPTKQVYSNSTNAQFTDANAVTAFNTDGFSLGADGTNGYVNYNFSSPSNLVSWTFRKQPKFFDVVTWTGNGAVRTISHSLGSTPGCIIVKCTNTGGNWITYHRSSSGTLILNGTYAAGASYPAFNDTAPTSTNFTVNSEGWGSNDSGNTYVAYLFAHNAGGFGLTGTDNVISCGSVTMGAGVTTINLGYEPQWIMFKQSNGVGDWQMVDSMRGLSQAGYKRLWADLSDAEGSVSSPYIVQTSTGFTMDGGVYGSGNTYIYIAIRRGPMKTPTDATKVFAPAYYASGLATGTKSTTNFPVDMQMVRYTPGTSVVNSSFADRLRGVSSNSTASGPYLVTSVVDPETTNSSLGWDNTGFLRSPNFGAADPAVYHSFQRAPGFFDEVCYTGTGTATTQLHSLGVVPELIIVKSRNNATNWNTYTASSTPNKRLYLDLTSALDTDVSIWNNTAPTSSVFSIGGSANVSTWTYVAYLFATCAGVSKVGSYTGTGTLTTINCGFAGGARFVLIKRTDSTSNWFVWDTARGMVAGTDPSLSLNTTSAESNANSVYTITTGFQLLASPSADVNTNGGTYIYLAIA
jgi:hypothetical protein